MNSRPIKRLVALMIVMFLSQSDLFAVAKSGTTSDVPRLIRFSGNLRDAQGNQRSGVVGLIFSIYSEQLGTASLWSETQNVTLDSQGRYTVLLGSEHVGGMSMDLFASSEAHWLGVRAEGEAEQARVLLVSVPYALKAIDSETLGGKPASAYVLAETLNNSVQDQKVNTSTAQRAWREPTAIINNGATNGTPNFLAKFDSSTSVVNSTIFQSGNSIGIGTTTPVAVLDIRDTGSVTIPGVLPTILINQSKSSGDGLVSVANAPDGDGAGLHGQSYSQIGGTGVWGESLAVSGNNSAGVYGSTQGTGIGGWFEAFPIDTNANATALLARAFYPNTVAAVFNNTVGGKILSLQSGDTPPDQAANAPEVLSVAGNGDLTTVGNISAVSGNFSGTVTAGSFAGVATQTGLTNEITRAQAAESLLSAGLTSLNAGNITSGVLSIAQGGTGSATQNFVDLTNTQIIAGGKTFSNQINGFSAAFNSNAAGAAVSGNNTANAAGAHGVQGIAQSNTFPSYGVYGLATQANGIGAVFRNSSSDNNGALVVRNAADTVFTFSVTSGGLISGNGSGISSLNASNLSAGTVNSARINGTYSNALTFSNAANSFTGSTLTLGGHINQSSANQFAGNVTAGPSTDVTFPTAYTSTPVCTATPTADLGSSGRFWVTVSNTILTIHTNSGSFTFNYICVGNPN